MKKTPNCNSCGQPMLEIGGIGKDEQIVQYGEYGLYKPVDIREVKLYQCPECKDVKLS